MAQPRDSAEIAREIRTRLKIAPASATELADEMKLDPQVIKTAIIRLLAAREVAMFQDRRRESGPFYSLPGYVERTAPIERDDLYCGRSYARFYDNPAPDL